MSSKTDFLNLHLYEEEDQFTILENQEAAEEEQEFVPNSLNGNMKRIDLEFKKLNNIENVQIIDTLPKNIGEENVIYLIKNDEEYAVPVEEPIVPDIVYYVSKNGSDSAPATGTEGAPFKTIKKAIETALNGYNSEDKIVQIEIINRKDDPWGEYFEPNGTLCELPAHNFTLILSQPEKSVYCPISLETLQLGGPTILKNIDIPFHYEANQYLLFGGYNTTIKNSMPIKPNEEHGFKNNIGLLGQSNKTFLSNPTNIKIQDEIDNIYVGNIESQTVINKTVNLEYEHMDGTPIFNLGPKNGYTTQLYGQLNISIKKASAITWNLTEKLEIDVSNGALSVINYTKCNFRYLEENIQSLRDISENCVWVYDASNLALDTVQFTTSKGSLQANCMIMATGAEGTYVSSSDGYLGSIPAGEYVLTYYTQEKIKNGYLWKDGSYHKIIDNTLPSYSIDQSYNPHSSYGQSGKAVAEAIRLAELKANDNQGVGLYIEATQGEIFNDYINNSARAYSHAEGRNTRANGQYSHTEGRDTWADGQYAHAEGYDTNADGAASHASGYGTSAEYPYQFVCGKYNDNKNDTIFEVGYGDFDNRKNIFEIKTNGSAIIPQVNQDEPKSITNVEYVEEHLSNMQSTIMNMIFPIGSIWVGGKNDKGEKIDPATLFGGTWTLIDKNFENSTTSINSQDDSLLVSNLPSDFVVSVDAIRAGNTLRMRIGIKSPRTYTDTNINIGQLNLNKVGVSNLSWSYNYLLGTTEYSTDETKRGAIIVGINHQGVIKHFDILPANGAEDVQYYYKDAAYSYYVDVTAPIPVHHMLDSFCDRFYWQRTA